MFSSTWLENLKSIIRKMPSGAGVAHSLEDRRWRHLIVDRVEGDDQIEGGSGGKWVTSSTSNRALANPYPAPRRPPLDGLHRDVEADEA